MSPLYILLAGVPMSQWGLHLPSGKFSISLTNKIIPVSIIFLQTCYWQTKGSWSTSKIPFSENQIFYGEFNYWLGPGPTNFLPLFEILTPSVRIFPSTFVLKIVTGVYLLEISTLDFWSKLLCFKKYQKSPHNYNFKLWMLKNDNFYQIF